MKHLWNLLDIELLKAKETTNIFALFLHPFSDDKM